MTVTASITRYRRVRHPGGFTLVELITVMILVGILAVAVMPRLDTLGGFDARGYADQIESYLRYAQKSALAGRRMVRLELVNCAVGDSACNSAPGFCVQQGHSAAPACDATTACGAAGMTNLSLPGQFRSPAGRVGVSGAGTVCFDSQHGRPIGGGRAIGITDNTGAAVRTVTVETETGYVH